MPDRKTPPLVKQVKDLQLPEPDRFTLSNGIPVYMTQMGTQEILKLEILFHAGRPFEHKRLAARATAALLKEGTLNYSSADIAEKIDFYGGTLSTPINLDYSDIVLYSLSKHFEKLLKITAEMVTKPVFPESELVAFGERNVQRLAVDLARNEVVAYRKITEFIFGENHPYGYNSDEAAYQALNRSDLEAHFSRNYHAGNCCIFLSGKTKPEHLELLEKYLGNSIPEGKYDPPVFTQHFASPQKITIEHPDSLQNAVRIGRRLFNRTHPDFNGMYVLNTVLGGYFGSRLMANIREDKGYTYNIFSSLDTMTHDGYFYIGTETGTEFTRKAIDEIYREIDILQNELIEKDELTMVKNYLLGNMLTMLDGAFNVSDVVKTYVAENLPITDFRKLTETVKDITAEELRELARKWLKPEDMWEVIV